MSVGGAEVDGREGTRSSGITVGGCLPDVDGRILQRLPGCDVGHLAVHVDDLCVGRRVKGDGGAVVPVRRVVSPKGAEDCRCREAAGAVGGGGEGDVVDEAGVRSG